MNGRVLLEQYRDLIIDKEEFERQGGHNLLNKISDAVIICNNHLITLLEKYINGEINKNKILEWTNTIWFSDSFDYCDEGCDCIASIMNRLEELDEGFAFDSDIAKKLIIALKSNEEI